MELTAAAIATLIATKAFEKTGEKLSEEVWGLVSKFLTSLKGKDSTTATAIERVAQQPELAEQQPQDYGTAVLVERVEAAVQSDEEQVIQKYVQAIAEAVRYQSPSIIEKLDQLLQVKFPAQSAGDNIEMHGESHDQSTFKQIGKIDAQQVSF